MALHQDKIALRAHFRQARRDINSDERAALSDRICVHLLKWLCARSDRTIALYLATPSEADLDALIEPLQVLGKRVVAPQGDGFAMLHAPSTCSSRDARRWREADSEAVDVEECDLILIPGVAFGRDGSRLGQGGGWYDRALRNSYATLLGVAFELQIVDALPTQEHDVWMQWIATEEGVRARTPPSTWTSTWSGLNLINP